MKSYKYIARDLSGIRKEGLKQASNVNDAISWLREQGFTPISVDEMSIQVKKTRISENTKRIKSSDLAAICWQLTTMVEGGIAITTALDTITEDIENPHLQHVLRKVLKKMERGETLSEGLSDFPKVFNALSRAIILAGETGGNLSLALHRLAEYFDNKDKLGKKVKGAMAYPCFVLGFVTLLVIFIMAFLVPRFKAIFDQMDMDMPAFTQAFMNFYDILKNNLLYIIGAVALIVISATLAYTKTKKGHLLFSKAVFFLPLLGKILNQAFIAMFCRTMATLLSAGVSVLEVFEILSTMTSNDITKKAITQTRDHIIEGSNISISMSSANFFPNMVIKMIQVGEESGSLAKVLDRTADYYERKVNSSIDTLMALLEPIMIVLVGGIVLIVVLALYLPIFSMSNTTG